jgi:transposase
MQSHSTKNTQDTELLHAKTKSNMREKEKRVERHKIKEVYKRVRQIKRTTHSSEDDNPVLQV